MNLQIGSTIGDYQVVGILGAGGMGKVYKVRNVISDRLEAMKVLLPDLAHEPELADRFLREIKVLAAMEHPNIAALHTAVRVENQLLMLMEFVDGETLEQKLRSGPLPVAQAVDYARQALSALAFAHSHGVIHRDIKPANMILTPGGVVKLMDFGIARQATDHKLTQTGTTLGSLYYMSPEQIQGSTSIDGRADLYSVGVSLYELVTGKRPFDGDSQFAIMSAHLQQTPAPPISLDPSLPAALSDAILLSVAKEADKRFQTAEAFRNALANVLPAATPAPQPVFAPPVQTPMPTQPLAQPAAAFAPPPQQQPAYQPPQPRPPAAAPAQKGKRGLWMAIGAVAVVAAIVAVVQFGPWKPGSAAPSQGEPAAAVIPTPAPQPAAAVAPVAEPTPAPQPAVAAPAPAVNASAKPQQGLPQRPAGKQSPQPVGRPAAQYQQAAPVQSYQPPPQSNALPQQGNAAPAAGNAPPAAAAPAGPSRAELLAVREQLMMVSTRANTVSSSLQALKNRQAASGLGLRGDIQEASSMMTSYLEGANAALKANDAAAAKGYMDKAERQLEKIEKFLGR